MKQVSLPLLLAIGMMAMGTSGCDKLVDTSNAAQEVTGQAFEDTKSSWRDFFTYHPPKEAPLPQTRYCYQSQADVVCYDSAQPQLTSKLVGFQHGESVAWLQPGGGSTGASGGEPEMLRPPKPGKYYRPERSNAQYIDTGPLPVQGGGPITTYTPTNGTDPLATGEINVNPLPPNRLKSGY